MKNRPSSRIPQLLREGMSAEQARVYDEIAAGPRGGVPGPLAVWMHSPRLAETAQQLGRFVRYESALPSRLSELAILVTGKFWGAEYEWWVHRPIAEAAGLDVSVVEAIREGRTPDFAREDERIVHDFVLRLHRDKRVDDSTYNEAKSVLGEVGVVDLVGICGYYTLISMTLNAFEVPLPDGEENALY